MHPQGASERHRAGAAAVFALPDAPVAVELSTVAGDGLVKVTSTQFANCLVRVGRVLGLAGPWSRAELSDTLDGVLRVVLRVRGRDPQGRLLADVIGIDDVYDPTDAHDSTLGAKAPRR